MFTGSKLSGRIEKGMENFRRVPKISFHSSPVSLWRVSSLVDFFFVIRGNKKRFKCLASIADTANFPGTILSWLLRGWFSRVLWCKPFESSWIDNSGFPVFSRKAWFFLANSGDKSLVCTEIGWCTLMHYKTIIIIYSFYNLEKNLKVSGCCFCKASPYLPSLDFLHLLGLGGPLDRSSPIPTTSCWPLPQSHPEALLLSLWMRLFGIFQWWCECQEVVILVVNCWIFCLHVLIFCLKRMIMSQKNLQALRRDGEGEPGFLHVAGTILSDLLVFRVFFVKMMIFRSIYVRFEELGVV